jgi:hypothetical protein
MSQVSGSEPSPNEPPSVPVGAADDFAWLYRQDATASGVTGGDPLTLVLPLDSHRPYAPSDQPVPAPPPPHPRRNPMIIMIVILLCLAAGRRPGHAHDRGQHQSCIDGQGSRCCRGLRGRLLDAPLSAQNRGSA